MYKFVCSTDKKRSFKQVETVPLVKGLNNFMQPSITTENIQAHYENSKLHICLPSKLKTPLVPRTISLTKNNGHNVHLVTNSEQHYDLQTITDFKGTIVGMFIIEDVDGNHLVAASTNGNVYSWKIS